MAAPGEWKLVSDASELSVGMTLKIEPCGKCSGARHVFLLTGRGESNGELGFFFTPTPACWPAPWPLHVSDWSMAYGLSVGYRKNLFRLVTGNDDTAEREEGKRDTADFRHTVSA